MEKRFSKLAGELVKRAERAAAAAHAPYSGIRVGAALFCGPDRIYHGMNVENASYGLSMCAERTAVYAALAAGERRFKLLVLYSPDLDPITPCGACLQVLAEVAPEIVIAVMDRDRGFRFYPLETLISRPFRIRGRPGK